MAGVSWLDPNLTPDKLKPSTIKTALSVLVLVALFNQTYATHLRAGEITVERVSCNSLTFRITVTVFTNTHDTPALFGGLEDWLDFGDGSKPILVPETPNVLRPDLGKYIGSASFTIERTYPGFGEFIIRYSEPNRNRNVLNMDHSVETRFYIETKIIIDPFLGCNNSPQFRMAPIDLACTGQAWTHNPGATDIDEDSLSYEFVTPFQSKDLPVVNYRSPVTAEFYLDPAHGNESASGIATMTLDAEGTIVWNAPGMSGEYNIAFVVKEWRKIRGRWYLNGYVRRDMQIMVDDCDNNRPDVQVPEDICVVAGTTIDETIIATDPDNDEVKVEMASDVFNFAPAQSPATWSPSDGLLRASDPPYQLNFHWQTECAHVKDQPYLIVVKVTDRRNNLPGLATYKTWRIRVVGPAPEWSSAQVDAPTRVATLSWNPYECQNADSVQVWRRVDSFTFSPDSCQTGIPAYLGYQKIAAVSASTSQFTDNNGGRGLLKGAQYCYRLVATFPSPGGGESYVSEERCVDPILADAPVITNVSVEKTSVDGGKILIRWTSPFEINEAQFPPPYQYEVYRAAGVSGISSLTKIHTGLLSDTIIVDEGLNTTDQVYNYRIVLWSASATNSAYHNIDTSEVASAIRLDAVSKDNQIQLTWRGVVPWSNAIQTIPNAHELFRGAYDSNLELIAEVDPFGGFRYRDQGQHDNTPLVPDREYCYRVMTRGAYGNPRIGEPLENYSQVACVKFNANEIPCKPVLLVQQTDCEEFLATQRCDVRSFRNTLSWIRQSGSCNQKILGYKVYRASAIDGNYVWLANAGIDGIVRDTSFTDAGENNHGLSSMAFCYRVAAVTRAGIEGEMSDASCNDNCPYYELPNMFSPADGNPCNDRFSAWRPLDEYVDGIDENGTIDWTCGEVDSQKCARFVKAVDLRVYNRWGKEVYTYRSGSERTIYIDWDGRDNEGRELSTGVYYYIADLTVDSIDPAKQNQSRKGWVHLIR